MKNIYFLVQLNPEVNFNTPNFDSYIKGLMENFLLANVLFLSVMLLIFVLYYSCCVLSLAWNKRKAAQTSNENSDIPVEIPVNI
jgi:hypothetical protein